jgi:surface protein
MAMLLLIVIALPGADADVTDLATLTTSKYKEHKLEEDFAYASCDATRLLPHAVDIGDCTAFLRYDATCTQTGLDGYTCFSKCQHGTLVDGRCFKAGVIIDLATASNPYRGSTSGNPNDIILCGNGPEQGFSYILAPGHGIAIGQTSTSFDSMHTLRHGGTYPGEVLIDCVDGPDESPIEFLNDGVEDVTVYFIVDASSSGEAGDFTLEWMLYTGGKDQSKVMGRVLNTYTPLTDSNIKTAAQLWATDQTSATSTYGSVTLWDLSQVTSFERLWCAYDASICGHQAYVAMRSFNGDISMWDVSKVTNMYRSKSVHIFEMT